MQRYITIPQIASQLGYSRMHVWRWADKGEIPGKLKSKKRGQSRYKRTPELERWMALSRKPVRASRTTPVKKIHQNGIPTHIQQITRLIQYVREMIKSERISKDMDEEKKEALRLDFLRYEDQVRKPLMEAGCYPTEKEMASMPKFES